MSNLVFSQSEAHRQAGRDANMRRIRGEADPLRKLRLQRRVRVRLERGEDGLYRIALGGGEPFILATDAEFSLWMELQEMQHDPQRR